MTGDRRRRYRVERGGRREEDRWGRSEVECRAVGGQRRLDRGEGKKGSVEGREERRGEGGKRVWEKHRGRNKTQEKDDAKMHTRKRATTQERRVQASGARKNDQPAQ